jgi:predicted O-methyltransferase YrrM
MSSVRRALRKLERVAWRALFTRAELARMGRAPNPRLRQLAQAAQATLDHEIEAAEAQQIDAIEALRRELSTSTLPADGAYSIGELCRAASQSPLWTLLLFEIVRACRPARCLELGTCLGISAAYQAAALQLNGRGFLVSLEGSEPRAQLAQQNLRKLGLDEATVVTGRFQDLLPEVLEEHAPFDYVFLDGHHQEDATLRYFDRIAPCLSPGAIVILDDIGWSAGMQRAWQTIRSRDAVAASIDLFLVGVCVVGGVRDTDSPFRLSIG